MAEEPSTDPAVNIPSTAGGGFVGFIFAFGGLGLLIGNLIGLTKESVVTAFIPLLLAFGGGTILAFLSNISAADRPKATASIGALSIACLIGLYTSLYVTEHRVLTPASVSALDAKGLTNVESRKLLRSEIQDYATSIDQQLRNKQLTVKEAYDRLLLHVQSLPTG